MLNTDVLVNYRYFPDNYDHVKKLFASASFHSSSYTKKLHLLALLN
jgi:hypothetical protein